MLERLKILWFSRNLKHIPEDYHLYLTKYNDYYNNLNVDLKLIFRERVFIAIQFIKFRPIQFSTVTLKMKILIASALIQITFGLNKYIMRRFDTIFIYPNTYKFGSYSALLGHVDYNANIIAMSWPSVKEGFVIPDDAMNVALHELSHALQTENRNRWLYDKFFNAFKMRNWEERGLREIYKIRAAKHPYLSEYAGQNLLELFAVSIECFFEQPAIFKHKVPKLYLLLMELLNQDPTRMGNPIIDRSKLNHTSGEL